MRSNNLCCRFDFSVYGTSFGVENVRKLEEMVAKAIAAKDDVERKICDSAEALSREGVKKVIFSVLTQLYPGGDCTRSNLPGDDLYD